jgi:hypothetical protein
MSIDGCPHSFHELAEKVLPGYMAVLRMSMEEPMPMSRFATPGVGIAGLLRQLGRTTDFRGCYVFVEEDRPVYVGISRSVIGRLRQHVRGSTHYDATLAYRIASSRVAHGTTRSLAMMEPEFRAQFLYAQDWLKGLNVAFVEVGNAVELYLFEAYCALELDTSEWNSFETH